MKLLWLKSNSILSRTIQFLTGDDCTHFCFVFESAANGLVFESNLLGTHPTFLMSLLSSHTTVHCLDVQMLSEEEDKIWDLVVQKYDGKTYDYLGALYLGITRFMHRAFKWPFPPYNKWAKKGYFCDEIYDVLNNFPRYFAKIDVMTGLDTPHDVWIKIGDKNGSNC